MQTQDIPALRAFGTRATTQLHRLPVKRTHQHRVDPLQRPLHALWLDFTKHGDLRHYFRWPHQALRSFCHSPTWHKPLERCGYGQSRWTSCRMVGCLPRYDFNKYSNGTSKSSETSRPRLPTTLFPCGLASDARAQVSCPSINAQWYILSTLSQDKWIHTPQEYRKVRCPIPTTTAFRRFLDGTLYK